MCKTWTTTDSTGVPFIPNGTYVTQIIYNDEYRKSYEEDLKRRQEEHLKRIREYQEEIGYEPYEQQYQPPWQPCLHDACPECHGTGLKFDGTMCIHNIACSCPRCSVYCNC